MTPEQMTKLNTSFTTLMMGASPTNADENTKMVSEKGPAFAKAISALTSATLSGYRPDRIMAAGMEPLQREVSSNRARLEK